MALDSFVLSSFTWSNDTAFFVLIVIGLSGGFQEMHTRSVSPNSIPQGEAVGMSLSAVVLANFGCLWLIYAAENNDLEEVNAESIAGLYELSQAAHWWALTLYTRDYVPQLQICHATTKAWLKEFENPNSCQVPIMSNTTEWTRNSLSNNK